MVPSRQCSSHARWHFVVATEDDAAAVEGCPRVSAAASPRARAKHRRAIAAGCLTKLPTWIYCIDRIVLNVGITIKALRVFYVAWGGILICPATRKAFILSEPSVIQTSRFIAFCKAVLLAICISGTIPWRADAQADV